MKKRVLIAVTAITLIGLSYFGFKILKVKKEQRALENSIYKGEFEFIKSDLNQPTILKNGKWVSKTDSLAGFEIDNGKWIMLYEGKKIDSNNIYDYKIKTEYLKELSTHSQPIEFLTLTNKIDTMDYMIFGSSKNKVRLSHIPSGKITIYTSE